MLVDQLDQETPDFLPLSYLNQLLYCPRRFWLMYVHGEMDINAPVLEGILRHERADQAGTSVEGNKQVWRRVYVWSETLRVAGFADFIEVCEGTMMPVEHKRGRMGKWINDAVQLCAQALCLEERTGEPVPVGEVFYWGSRRRVRVEFDEALREKTVQTAKAVFALLAAGQLPDPTGNRAKCQDCSLAPICLPDEVLLLRRGEEMK